MSTMWLLLQWSFWIFLMANVMPIAIMLTFVIGGLFNRFNKLICRNSLIAIQRAKYTLTASWIVFGWIWYGYEIKGMENLPCNSPAVMVCYHGSFPVDVYLFISHLYRRCRRIPFVVAERFIFNIPGGKLLGITDYMKEVCNASSGTVEECVEHLKRNDNVFVCPGGNYEAQFSDSHYKLHWKNRTGFAKMALDAKVPIIPIFTKNIRAAFYVVPLGKFIHNFILKLRLPFAPTLGGLPVKLVTYVGKPIPYDETLSPIQLKEKVAHSLEQLIAEHQEIPGSVLQALWERFSFS